MTDLETSQKLVGKQTNKRKQQRMYFNNQTAQ